MRHAFRTLCCALAVIPTLASGCARTSPTSVRVQLAIPGDLPLRELEVSLGEQGERLAVRSEVLLLVSDAIAGVPTTVRVRGLSGDEVVASGRATVTPIRHREVAVFVSLSRIACGAWCSRGATECRGAALVTCEQRDEDPCMEWSDAIACPATSPACSLGTCGTSCVDECAAGELQCAGPGATRGCGQADADPCLDLLAPVDCGPGLSCVTGRCEAECRDACAAGTTRCVAQGVATCGDYNDDACLEWGPPVPCTTGQSCELGRCLPVTACTDECDANRCEADMHRVCGNYDLDSCTELSVGTPCAAAPGACDLVACTPGGCVTTPTECPGDGGVAPMDAGARPDAGRDGGDDAGADAGTDARVDAGTDAGTDARVDAGTDAGTDARRDAGTDAGAGADAGPFVGAPALPPDGTVYAGTSCTGSDFSGDNTHRCRAALAIDRAGYPHLAVYSPSANEVLHLAWSGTAWLTSSVERGTGNTDVAVTVDGTGEAFVAYEIDGRLTVARAAGGVGATFRSEFLTTLLGAREGSFSMARVPSRDTVVIALCGDVRLANEVWWYTSTPSGGWTLHTDTIETYCQSTSTAAGESGDIRVLAGAQYGSLGARLELFPGSLWRNDTTDTGAVGVWASGPFVAYRTTTTPRELRFSDVFGDGDGRIDRATSDGTFYDLRVVTSAGGVPHAFYRRSGSPASWHAVRMAGGTWVTAPLMLPEAADAGSLAVAPDQFGRIVIAYAGSSGAFRFASLR